MRIIALTGGIGAGKSTAAAMFAEHGGVVIDVDSLGRAALEQGSATEQAVIAQFGSRVVGADGHISRPALAAVVFNDLAELAALEAISHPAIDRMIDELLDTLPAGSAVVWDMAVLYGSRLGRQLPSGRTYSTVVAVEAPLEDRIRRLVDLRGLSLDDARARIASQPSDEQRRTIADHVVLNDGDLAALRAQVDRLWPIVTAA